MQIITQLREILKGIDSSDTGYFAWWETSTGAEFGAGKLQEIEELVRPLAESHWTLYNQLDYLVREVDEAGWHDSIFEEAKKAITAAEQLTKGDA